MEVTKFKAIQEPIKALYRKDANAPFLTLKAGGSASDSTVTCKVETGRGLALARGKTCSDSTGSSSRGRRDLRILLIGPSEAGVEEGRL
jgi:hypothetical protein